MEYFFVDQPQDAYKPLVRLNTSLSNLDIDNPATIKLDLQISGNNTLPLTPDDLAGMDPKLLTEMEQASINGDTDKIYSIISNIRLHNEPVADGLLALAEEFEFDQILELVKKSLSGV